MIKSEDEAEKQPQEAAAVQDEAPRKRGSRKGARAGGEPGFDGPDPWAAKLERAEQLESAGSHVDAAELFQAVATALASTVGVGNIAGVATAISIGGPGALFWLWVSGIFGMAGGMILIGVIIAFLGVVVLKRFGSMMAAICLGTFLGIALLTGASKIASASTTSSARKPR